MRHNPWHKDGTMVRNALKWSLAPAALVAMALGQAWAQDVSSGAPVAYSYAGDATPPGPPAATPAAPAAPAEGCAATTSCGCDTCNGGCNNQCCCDDGCVFDWDKNTWVKVGAGLRFSFDNIEQHTLTGHKYKFFSPDDMRIYLSGQGHEYIKFTLNTEIGGDGTFVSPDNLADVRLLDGIIQFEIDDLVNVWMGRMLPPSDQANLDGPFYQTPYLYPFVSNYASIFAGRDDGAAYWGQLCGGQVKWAVGVFNGIGRDYAAPNFFGAVRPVGAVDGDATGPNENGDLLYAGRFAVNLLDPQPGYYTQDSYFGKKDILELAVVAQYQDHAVNDGTTTPFSGVQTVGRSMFGSDVELMYETRLRNCGVFTVNAAYYDYQDHHQTNQFAATQEGDAGFAQVSYYTADDYCFGKVSGKFQPYARFQRYNRDEKALAASYSTTASPVLNQQTDFGVNYVISGYNARLTLDYSEDLVENNGGHFDQILFGGQVQF